MITFIIILTGFILAGLVLKSKFSFQPKTEADKFKNIKAIGFAVLIILVMIILSAFQPYNLERVDAGHVGIKVKLTGDNRGVSKYEYKTGWVVYNEWFEKLYEFPTFQQHIDYPEQTVITKGGFNVTIKPSFNYALKAGDVGDMFQNLRVDIKQIEQGWLSTSIVGAVNDVANKWNVDDIFNQREKFEYDIKMEVNKRVVRWFLISQLRTNITPPPALQSAILAKTKAVQDVQVAENQRLVAVAEGDTKIAQARADSASAVIAAAGRSEAIKKEQLNLSPMYLDYIKIQKWDGSNSQVVTGGGSTMLNIGVK